jgi:chromosomal replication initiator protein
MFNDDKNDNDPFRGAGRASGAKVPGQPATDEQRALWQRVLAVLRAELGEKVFISWFLKMEILAVENGVVHLSVPTAFLKSWVQQHFATKVMAALAREMGDVRDFSISVRGSTARTAQARSSGPATAAPKGEPAMPSQSAPTLSQPPAAAALPADSAAQTRHADPLGGSPLDRRLTFKSFLTGQSNAFAHAACMQAARTEPGLAPLYNPLYLHAQVGLGKTHLCQALAQQAEGNGRRVIYLTAERFMYSFVAALKSQTAIAFKEMLRGIDMLVIDDIQFLHGKTIQQEFCHTLNALIDAGKQVVVAADRVPSDLETVEDRMCSRLQAGLVVEIQPLDEALRIAILETRIAAARAHLPTFEVRPEVVTWLARQLTANGRDLEGAVNRMLAHAALSGKPLDLATAEAAIKDLIRQREPKKVKIEDIQRLVASHYNVSKSDILSARRTASVVRPRQIAMYLSKALTLRSLPEIGRRFGGRDHTTVLHAVRKIEQLSDSDQRLSGEIDLLKRMLLE